MQHTYKNPRQNRQRSKYFFDRLIRSLMTGIIGMPKIRKSVTMFMAEVRYHTGSV